MQIAKIKKTFFFALLFVLTVLIVLIVKPPTVTASCMCDCFEVPGTCGGTMNTMVENCYMAAGDESMCATGGCSGNKVAMNCAWTF